MLTYRQQEVLTLISEGHSHKSTASRMKISTWTVRDHTRCIRLTLGARNNAHAVAIAFQKGLLR